MALLKPEQHKQHEVKSTHVSFLHSDFDNQQTNLKLPVRSLSYQVLQIIEISIS
jgi:hypothetical protein